MDIGFTEEQELLRDTARKFLDGECPTSFVRQMMATEAAVTGAFWQKLADNGWLGITYAEEDGGSGLGLVDLVVLMEEVGRAGMPGPYPATVLLGGAAVAAARPPATRQAGLPKIAAGRGKATLAADGAAGRIASGLAGGGGGNRSGRGGAVGRDLRRGAAGARHDGRLRQAAHRLRQADRQLSGREAQMRRHADRDRKRQILDLSRRLGGRRGGARRRAGGVDGEGRRLGRRAQGVRRRDPAAWRHRHYLGAR